MALYTIREMGPKVGIHPQTFWGLIRTKKIVPPPRVQVPGRRLRFYDEAGYEEVKAALTKARGLRQTKQGNI